MIRILQLPNEIKKKKKLHQRVFDHSASSSSVEWIITLFMVRDKNLVGIHRKVCSGPKYVYLFRLWRWQESKINVILREIRGTNIVVDELHETFIGIHVHFHGARVELILLYRWTAFGFHARRNNVMVSSKSKWRYTNENRVSTQ